MKTKILCLICLLAAGLFFLPIKSYASGAGEGTVSGESREEILNETLQEEPEETETMQAAQEMEQMQEMEQTAEGWDFPVSQDELVSRLGRSAKTIIFDGVEPDASCGWMTFKVIPPSTVHGQIFLLVMNETTYQVYGIVLLEVNSYSQMVCLPAGTYIIVDGGSGSDSDSRYFFEAEEVRVVAQTSSVYTTYLFDSVDPKRTDYPTGKNPITQKTAEQEAKEKLLALEEQIVAGNYDEDNGYQQSGQGQEASVPVPVPSDGNQGEEPQAGSSQIVKKAICIAAFILVPLVFILAWKRKHRNFKYRADM